MARAGQCANNLKQMGDAIYNYHGVTTKLPPSRVGPQHATWFVVILPYMEQEALFNQWNLALLLPADARASRMRSSRHTVSESPYHPDAEHAV